MIQFGYKMMTEEHGPKELVENARMAEDAGFDFVSISDHFHPWLEAQGHSPFAWSVLGAIAHATSKIAITTGLTCPLIRYHPANIAQDAETIAVMSDNRCSLARCRPAAARELPICWAACSVAGAPTSAAGPQP